MARPLNTQETPLEKVAPALAVAALSQGGLDNPEIKALLAETLLGIKERREKAAKMQERMDQQRLQTIAEMEAQKAQRQSGCSHLKQDGRSTRLAGQVTTGIAGKRQLVLVCQWCHKEYHTPPNAGQEAPPQHLIPPGDEIGG
jgi:hypothetical protein